jgi:hypothetical protein
MDRLKPRSKAAKLRALMRLIEAKIEEGVLAHHHQTSVPTPNAGNAR